MKQTMVALTVHRDCSPRITRLMPATLLTREGVRRTVSVVQDGHCIHQHVVFSAYPGTAPVGLQAGLHIRSVDSRQPRHSLVTRAMVCR
jgi:hypothetical protein